MIALALAALLFALMGALALAAPNRVLGQFGVPPLPRDAPGEVRAVYGGFGLAVAIMLILAAAEPALRDGIALMVAAALLGMAAGRAASAAIDRGIGALPAAYLVGEAAVALLLLFGA